MKASVRRRLRRGVVILSTLAVVSTMLTGLERRRIRATATPPATTAQPELMEGRNLLADVERLASPQFEGRRTGSRGNKATQDFIIERFRAAKIDPAFGSTYRQPFSFTHHSIKGLLSPWRPYKTEYADAANLGGVIRGTSRPERFIALSAHYDSFGIREGRLFPGADDNASGVAVMLGIARVLAERPLRHSVMLLAFDAEEIGIRGARHFVANPPMELSLLDVVVNLDMVGRGDDNLLVASGTSHYPSLEAPVRAAAATRSIQVVFGHDRPLYKAGLVDDWTGSSDHGPFHGAGVPFVYFGVEDHADYHQPTDTADKIQGRFLNEVATLVADVLVRLDALPPRVR
jgi:hypothetical protein